jgi:hypothetical protein
MHWILAPSLSPLWILLNSLNICFWRFSSLGLNPHLFSVCVHSLVTSNLILPKGFWPWFWFWLGKGFCFSFLFFFFFSVLGIKPRALCLLPLYHWATPPAQPQGFKWPLAQYCPVLQLWECLHLCFPVWHLLTCYLWLWSI